MKEALFPILLILAIFMCIFGIVQCTEKNRAWKETEQAQRDVQYFQDYKSAADVAIDRLQQYDSSFCNSEEYKHYIETKYQCEND